MAVGALVGREDAVDRVAAVLDRPERLPVAAVAMGPAGIGKTTVWSAGVADAATAGYRVLSTRATQAEASWSFAGLADLIHHDARPLLPELPPVQRRALEGELLLGDPETEVHERAVAAAVLNTLQLLSRGGPVLVAVDDLHWLDAASLATLRHALPRLLTEPVATLVAVRDVMPDWLVAGFAADRLETVQLGPLSLGATHEQLRTRLQSTVPRAGAAPDLEDLGREPVPRVGTGAGAAALRRPRPLRCRLPDTGQPRRSGPGAHRRGQRRGAPSRTGRGGPVRPGGGGCREGAGTDVDARDPRSLPGARPGGPRRRRPRREVVRGSTRAARPVPTRPHPARPGSDPTPGLAAPGRPADERAALELSKGLGGSWWAVKSRDELALIGERVPAQRTRHHRGRVQRTQSGVAVFGGTSCRRDGHPRLGFPCSVLRAPCSVFRARHGRVRVRDPANSLGSSSRTWR